MNKKQVARIIFALAVFAVGMFFFGAGFYELCDNIDSLFSDTDTLFALMFMFAGGIDLAFIPRYFGYRLTFKKNES